MEPSQNLLSSELHIDSVGSQYLKETAMWARFLGIVGFIFSTLITIGAFFVGSFMAFMPTAGSMPAGVGGLVTVIYLLIGALGFFISLQAYRFGTKTKSALLNDDQFALTAGLSNLKTMFKIYGIIIIIYLAIIALATVFGLLGALFNK